MSKQFGRYKRHRFPPEIIAHVVWLCFRFPLSLRLVEEMLLERGIIVSCETVRRWAMKFGPDFGRCLKRKAAQTGDVWHLDEVVTDIGCEKRRLWRAVDQDGYGLDEIVQKRRDKHAAVRLLRRLLKKQGLGPTRIVTDKLGSYGAAKATVMPVTEHRSHKGLNNRAENSLARTFGSHLPIRKREKLMQGFRSRRSLRRFVSVFSVVRHLFVPPRQIVSAFDRHLHRVRAFAAWTSAASIPA
jgi:putative transposase